MGAAEGQWGKEGRLEQGEGSGGSGTGRRSRRGRVAGQEHRRVRNRASGEQKKALGKTLECLEVGTKENMALNKEKQTTLIHRHNKTH